MGYGLPFAFNILIEGTEVFLSLMFPHGYFSVMLCPSDVVTIFSVCIFIFILSDLLHFPLSVFSFLGLNVSEEFRI